MPGEYEEVTLERAYKLVRSSPASYLKLLQKLRKSLINAFEANQRRLLVICGSDPYVLGGLAAKAIDSYLRLRSRLGKGTDVSILYVFHDEFDDAKVRKDVVKLYVKDCWKKKGAELRIIRYEESARYLGTTFDVLVMDLVNDLKPNDVGRLVGIVRGGGLIIFMAPPWKEWDTKLTLFKKNLTVPQHPEPRHVFVRWFKQKLMKHKGVFIYDADNRSTLKATDAPSPKAEERKIEIPEDHVFPEKLYKLALTQDQVNAIKLMELLVEKPPKGKRRAIVLTADRGRGKSCAVGIALAGIIYELRRVKPRVRVLVTAQEPTCVQSLMELARRALEALGLKAKPIERGGSIIELQGERFSIEFWEPLHIVKMKADVVAVDEAAGLPVPMLHAIWKAHRRLIFASTIHGYEGAGRGFSVRFLKALEEDPKTELHVYEMEEPIRYAKNDPIEEWQFKTLLLDAEPAKLDEEDLEAIERLDLKYLRLDPEWLFSEEGEETLRQLFGIYVLAHYRNEPDDLGMLADAPHHSVRALATPKGKVVCAVQLAEEGPIEEDHIDDLLRGGKIPGNIIPDRFLKHARIRDFGRTVGWRIVRIATHPQVQGRGIGSKMLEEIEAEARERGYDWVGSGFGVNERLLRFWLKNGFVPIHMSPDRNPVSGEYTVLVLKPLKKETEEMTRIANLEFRKKLVYSLHDPYKDLEAEVARLILLSGDDPLLKQPKPRLSPIEIDRLWIYSYGPMTYEAISDVLNKLARFYWLSPKDTRPPLKGKQELILITKVLQGRSWDWAAEELHTRPQRIMVELKEIARIMLKHYFDRDAKSPVGITLS